MTKRKISYADSLCLYCCDQSSAMNFEECSHHLLALHDLLGVACRKLFSLSVETTQANYQREKLWEMFPVQLHQLASSTRISLEGKGLQNEPRVRWVFRLLLCQQPAICVETWDSFCHLPKGSQLLQQSHGLSSLRDVCFYCGQGNLYEKRKFLIWGKSITQKIFYDDRLV